MIVGLLCLATVLLVAAGLIWWGSLYRSSIQPGNDADKLYAQFNSDWPTFVGKPESSSTYGDHQNSTFRGRDGAWYRVVARRDEGGT
jgi:hypothetical protein